MMTQMNFLFILVYLVGYLSVVTGFQVYLQTVMMTRGAPGNTKLTSVQASMSPPPHEPPMLVDSSTLVLLEHININVPDHTFIVPFYYHLLGMSLDPRRAQNLATGKGTLWANCGASQFHLPFGETAQVVPGVIGLRYESLEPLEQRLAQYEQNTKTAQSIKPYREYSIESDPTTQAIQRIRIVDFYGNVFLCRKTITYQYSLQDICSNQPCLDARETSKLLHSDSSNDTHRPLTSLHTPDCKGIDFVEIYVPEGTAEKIAEFYDCLFDATVSVIEAPDNEIKIAIVAFGNIDSMGRSSQSLIFREVSCQDPDFHLKIKPYDGYHIALYVGTNAADFEQSFRNCEDAGVVWVNPRFADKAMTLTGAQTYKQFRFKNILDLETGQVIFQMEHEVRSIEHEAWPGAYLE